MLDLGCPNVRAAAVKPPCSTTWQKRSQSLQPYHQKVIANKSDGVDRRNIGRMLVPGIFLLDTMFAPAGKGAETGVKVEGTREYRNAQFMTPETRRTSHFFWNYLHNYDIDNPNITLSLRNSLEEAFNEDKALIEGQQKMFDIDPDFKLLAIGSDAALSHFRWVFGQRVAFEYFTAPAEEKLEPIGSNAFEILLQKSGRRLTVPPDRSILDVLEESGVMVPFACREGMCRTCETTVCEGEIDHRDYVLSEEERESGKMMMLCVSRGKSRTLVLDL
jgi:ferredoxin